MNKLYTQLAIVLAFSGLAVLLMCEVVAIPQSGGGIYLQPKPHNDFLPIGFVLVSCWLHIGLALIWHWFCVG